MLLQQVIGAADDEIHHFDGGVEYAQRFGGDRVVGFIKIFVNGFNKPLFFAVIGDIGGGGGDSAVVGQQFANGFAAQAAGKESLRQSVQLPGDVVFLMELVFGKHAQENVFGQDVLNQHFLDIKLRNLRADGAMAKLQETGGGGLIMILGGSGCYGCAQGG